MFTHHIHKIPDNVALLQMRTEYGHLQIDLGLVTQPLLRHSLKQSRNEPRFLAELARAIIHGRIRGISTIMGRAAGPVVPRGSVLQPATQLQSLLSHRSLALQTVGVSFARAKRNQILLTL